MVEFLSQTKVSRPDPFVLAVADDPSFAVINRRAVEQSGRVGAADVCFKAFFERCYVEIVTGNPVLTNACSS